MAEPVMLNATPPSGGREKRLLAIVDGDSASLYYASIVLQRLEYNIHTAKSAEDVLALLDVARPALVIAEVSLPGMDGIEFLKKIKRNPRTFAIPVIILTSSKDPAAKEACLREHCAAYLQKPLEPDVLYAAIQKATESMPRSYIRVNTCLNVMVGDDRAAELSVVEDYISALSENGMFVSTSKPKSVGIQVPVTIFLEKSRIQVEGMVLYSFKRGEGPMRTAGMGIKFVRIKPEDQNLIRLFIRKEITKGLTMGQLGGTVL